MTRFLPDGQSIRREVHRLFQTERGRRVAIVAFIGKSAEAYLPKPAGIELVCWPHAPGTNPETIKLLIRKGVDVRFAERLHMKVYWTATKGAVVASSNLSTNAYGAGALHEAGVVVPSSLIDIDSLLESTKPKKVTVEALNLLGKMTKHAKRTHPPNASKRTFLDWLEDPKRTPWRLHCFDGYGGGASKRLKVAAKNETGSSNVQEFFYCRRNEINPHDFVLCIDLASQRKPLVDRWVFVHQVVLVARDDSRYTKEWPFQAGQFHVDSACPRPPFQIDGVFRKAVRRTYKSLEGTSENFSLERTSRPEKLLLSHLEKHYRAVERGQ